VDADDMRPFDKQKSMGLSLIKLTDMLNGYISMIEQLFIQNAEMACIDISIAVQAAMWAISAVYFHAENSVAASPVNKPEDEALTAKMVG
jgi:hypothetical protein